jgi:hypothetical protein
MSIRQLTTWCALLLAGAACSAPARQADSTAARRELPALEIPELTIVGKKAITLPFARKGEIYDVSVYEAPAADTTLLLDRLEPGIPVGSLPRYEQRQMPWRSSLEGSFGSFATGGIRAYVDYSAERWGIAGTGSYRRTNGHTDNSGGTSTLAGATIHSLLATDNTVLLTMRASFGAEFGHDSYGMMGGAGATLERKRDNVVIDGRLGSLNRQGLVLDMRLGANIWKVSDALAPADSSVTVVSPEVGASLAADVGRGRLLGDLSFASSSLDYQHATESPSLLSLGGSFRWDVGSGLLLQAGGRYASGSSANGATRSLVAPTARVTWQIDEGRSIALWFEPEMSLPTYDEQVRLNPYLVRELDLTPERKILHFGGTFWYNRGIVTMELRAAFGKSSGKDVTIADSAGLRLVAADVFQTEIGAEGTLRPGPRTRVRFSAMFRPSFEDGTTTQLPMTPLAALSARGELDLVQKVMLWASGEYRSKQNVDFTGTRTIGDAFHLGAGATASFLAHAELSVEARNLLNSTDSWWAGIPAPGRTITLGAKLRLQ